jgi:hypothetical protein
MPDRTNYIAALNWGASGSAETTTTLGEHRADTKIPDDIYHTSGLQLARYGASIINLTGHMGGGNRLRVYPQSASQFGTGEYGFQADTGRGYVAINGAIHSISSVATIADPGDGAAIPVTSSGFCAMTSGGAGETRSIAIPAFRGEQIDLICDTHGGGNIVVTASQVINQAGNTVMTFGAAADACSLRAMTVAGALRWRVVYNDGVALS